MTGVSWQRWVLGALVASIVPIAIGGAGCGGKDETPSAAGASSTSGSAAGGTSAGTNAAGSATAGSATAGSATAGTDAGGTASAGTDAGGTASAGTAAGGTASAGSATGGTHSGGRSGDVTATCCNPGDNPACSGDGRALKSCLSVMGSTCQPGIYAYVWQTQECAQGCELSGNSGAAGTGIIARCK